MVCAAFIHQKRGLRAPLVVVAGGREKVEKIGVVFSLMILLLQIIKKKIRKCRNWINLIFSYIYPQYF